VLVYGKRGGAYRQETEWLKSVRANVRRRGVWGGEVCVRVGSAGLCAVCRVHACVYVSILCV